MRESLHFRFQSRSSQRCLAADVAHAERITNALAVFAALDKVTGRVSPLEIKMGQTVTFGVLKVTARACYTRPPTENPLTSAFIEVDELLLDGSSRRVFTGWTFAARYQCHELLTNCGKTCRDMERSMRRKSQRPSMPFSIPCSQPFSLDQTLRCGQVFRWDRAADGTWTGVVGDSVIHIRQDGRKLTFDGVSGPFIRHYFSLIWIPGPVIASFDRDSFIHEAVCPARGSG